MSYEINLTNMHRIKSGDFPLNHDCILKVSFSNDCPLRFSYYTCRSQDSGVISNIISNLPLVRIVEISSVEKLGLLDSTDIIPDFVLQDFYKVLNPLKNDSIRFPSHAS